MCQATIYLERGGEEKELLHDVISMERTADGWMVKPLLEPSQKVQGRIVKIDFLKHSVTLVR